MARTRMADRFRWNSLEKTLNKIIITRMDGRILTAISNGSRIVQMNMEEESQSLLGNIYIGRVKNIAKNINAAFIDLGDGKTAYYSLTENRQHLFAGGTGEKRTIHSGDEIVVQVVRDAVKTKDPVVTGCLSLTGRFCVVTFGKCQIGFSSKITDGEWKNNLRSLLEEEKEDNLGVIVRTNAWHGEISEILEEFRYLKGEYKKILSQAVHRTCYHLLYEAMPAYMAALRDTYEDFMEEILTDDKDIFQEIQAYLRLHQPKDVEKVRLYEDSLCPLSKLYSLEKAVDDALQKRVWLKSGGYLVIEPTEAMTVIDVNSGKYSGKKDLNDTIKKINLEAAAEVAYQLRLRNLSGMIVVDFIDMASREDQDELMDVLTLYCKKDPVKTTVVDMTKLGLVEITRKKIRKPFWEQVYKGDQKR